MSQQTVQMGDPPLDPERRRTHHPGLSLAVIVACQLMVVLDASVMFVALPKIQHSLHFSATGLSWVTNAYSLAFGGLLLLGGRAGDILGRRRTFIAGIALFTLASLLGGFSGSAAWLLATRTAQGVGAALAAPSALALIATNFQEGPERNRALGVFSATSSAGASIGLVLGGLLTDWASWRWVLFINVPVGAVVLFLAPRILRETERHRGRLDVAGAVTVVTGMVALVYGFIRAADAGWGDGVTLAAFTGGVLLLGAFVVVETRAEQPVIPLRLFADGPRAGSYLIMLLLAAAMFGMFFFIVQFLQNVLGFSPLKAGVAFLPMSGLLFVMARTTPRLMPRVGPRRLLFAGLPLIAVGLVWLTRLSAHSGYAPGVLGPMLLFGLGAGLVFLPITATVLAGVRREDSGAASGTLQTAQQVGGALGMAVLVAVYGPALRHGGLTHGVNVAFTVGTVFVLVALAVTVVLLRPRAA
ncbi:MFS transporter [Actinoallomurus spadix]|uniref:MFS transporter n=1 Tax=Actinoallomurus spadix TaxID=79912 RepID=A0ABN0X0C2_9ACTN|nr:MFS transporter [Actinoallomurus spadix]MCO5989016.1 MFS transporter [Actinoallomurus spadix]